MSESVVVVIIIIIIIIIIVVVVVVQHTPNLRDRCLPELLMVQLVLL